jgi:hypothetical protein
MRGDLTSLQDGSGVIKGCEKPFVDRFRVLKFILSPTNIGRKAHKLYLRFQLSVENELVFLTG